MRKKPINISGQFNNQGAVVLEREQSALNVQHLSLTTEEESSSVPGLEQISEAGLTKPKFMKVKKSFFLNAKWCLHFLFHFCKAGVLSECTLSSVPPPMIQLIWRSSMNGCLFGLDKFPTDKGRDAPPSSDGIPGLLGLLKCSFPHGKLWKNTSVYASFESLQIKHTYTAEKLQHFNFAGQSHESITNFLWADYHLPYVSSPHCSHDFPYLALLSYLNISVISAYLKKASRC